MTRSIGIAAFEYHRPVVEAFERTRALGVSHCELVTPNDVTVTSAAQVAKQAAAAGVEVTAVASLSLDPPVKYLRVGVCRSDRVWAVRS